MCDLIVTLAEIKQFLNFDARQDVVESTLKLLVSLSTNKEMLEIMSSNDCADLLKLLCKMIDYQTLTPSNRALLLGLFVNLTADQHSDVIASNLLASRTLMDQCLNLCLSDQKIICQLRAAQFLSNLTRIFPEQLAEKFSSTNKFFLSNIIDQLCAMNYYGSEKNNKHPVINYLGFTLMNLSVVSSIGVQIAARDKLPKLIALLNPQVCRQKRMVVIETIYNLSMQDELHALLLCDEEAEDQLLSALLAPLVDAGDQLDDEEMAKLPIGLQYWEGRREMDTEIWDRVLRTLYQLCATRLGREVLRRKGIYALLRELDKAKGNSGQQQCADEGKRMTFVGNNDDDEVLRALIGMLIRTEEDMGLGRGGELIESIRKLGA